MKYSILLIVLISQICFSQSRINSIIIKTDIYESTFDTILHQPIEVRYVLFRGGGECKRSTFKTDIAENQNYAKTGYDRGHLANAEDFAYDCDKGESTFRYYNCLPQTPSLNRGTWKSIETDIREQSQSDSLLIVCGGFQFYTDKSLNVPAYCYKVVQNLRTDEIIFCAIFDNDDTSVITELTLIELETYIEHKILLK
jgi:hypothetical protein